MDETASAAWPGPPWPGSNTRKILGLALTCVVSACAHRQDAHGEAPTAQEFAAAGYAPPVHDAFTTATFSWRLAGQDMRFILARPARRNGSAVVVYMPGLGESSESGARWRSAWATAGYAVLSVQPLDDDATAWTSELARDGDFKALGRQRFAEGMVIRRVQRMASLLDEGQRRSKAGDPDWQGLDWSKVAIAGFDLGAYTTMTLAGEHIGPGAAGTPAHVRFRAAIALSPYATRAAATVDARYRDIDGPVLSMTGDSDADPLGLVEASDMRTAPFARMDGPDKFLLSLSGFPHAGFSGNPMAERDKDSAERPKRAADSPDKAGQSRRGGKRGNAKDADSSSPDRSLVVEEPPRLSAEEMKLRVVAVQDVSTAFLDAYVNGDAHARAWLTDTAPRWLGGTGALDRK